MIMTRATKARAEREFWSPRGNRNRSLRRSRWPTRFASMNAASPSPAKKQRHTLPLAERTRLSMARGSHPVADGDDSGRSSCRSAAPRPSLSDPPSRAPEGDDDLVARTPQHGRIRSGSATCPAGEETVPTQIQDVYSAGDGARGQLLPAVDEDGEELEQLLLAEELMSGEPGYEAVFMSRPKIKTSPVGTPGEGDARIAEDIGPL